MQKANFRRRMIAAMAVAFVATGPSTAAHAWTETVLHSFTDGSDGGAPVSNLIADQGGNLYGTTEYGGSACTNKRGCGALFELAPDGTETVLYAFHKRRDGGRPRDGLIMDSQGNLYGTTFEGGKNRCGTVFQVTPQGVETVLYAFKCNADGEEPVAGLVFDGSGNLYGTTGAGGLDENGTVFEVTPGGGHTVLYTFQGGSDGRAPSGPLIFDAAGNLYGTTLQGGSTTCAGGGGCGTVFKLAPDRTETVLHAFQGGRDGIDPSGGLIMDASGNLYGTTGGGGGTGCYNGAGCGTVFELAPDGTETILSEFNRTGGPEGPVGGVIMDDKGNLFGATFVGGATGFGTVFKVAPGANAKAIYSFKGGKDGAYPVAGLLQDASGNLFGTTESGGSVNWGTVFELKQ